MQVLIRRELEEAAKTLGERARQSDATSEVLPAVHYLDDLSHLLRSRRDAAALV